MKHSWIVFVTLLPGLIATTSPGQATFSGRVRTPMYPGATDPYEFAAVHIFGSRPGEATQPAAHRTFEMYPRSWYIISGGAGCWTVLFTGPAKFMRPLVLTNQYADDGVVVDRVVWPPFDYACFDEGGWDEAPAAAYYQTFTATGTAVTHVGFKPVHDGVDGDGPGGRDILVSVHRVSPGPPQRWEQVGPTALVPFVDCGGVKGYEFSTAWRSGEVPLVPGETYAVRIAAAEEGGTFQMFWRKDEDPTHRAWRIGPDGAVVATNADLWMAVGVDGDGLLIPYAKRVHKEFVEFAGFGAKWTQSWVAQGESLAGAVLYAAVSGTQPSQNRQRVRVTVREDGPDGPVVGVRKIAIGNANYTGDASWGMFGLAYEPGEVPLVPGKTYAMEFTAMESWETLHGFVNFKGQVNNMEPGFNPYQKTPPDEYPLGTAWREGDNGDIEECKFDLDMQILEYAATAENWHEAVTGPDLLVNGDMEEGELGDDDEADGTLAGWETFAVDPGTIHHYVLDGEEQNNRIARVIGGGYSSSTVDGGYVQKVEGLDPLENYRVTGKVRSSYAVDQRHRCMVGFDPTGQTEDPDADTIEWTIFPDMLGKFFAYGSDPIRPTGNSISVWLRAWTDLDSRFPFRADFDDFSLRRVATGIPGQAAE